MILFISISRWGSNMKKFTIILIVAIMAVFGANQAGAWSLELTPSGHIDVTGETSIFFDVIFNSDPGGNVLNNYAFNLFYDTSELSWNSTNTNFSAPSPLISGHFGLTTEPASGFIQNINAGTFGPGANVTGSTVLAHVAFDILNPVPVFPYVWFDTAAGPAGFTVDGVVWSMNNVFILSGIPAIPKTGQTTCYDAAGNVINCAGTGQDGEIQAGVAWPNPRFILGTGAETECITDNLTGLMWPRNGNIPGGTRTWQEALDYIASINNGAGLCGYSDWVLPNINELLSLVNVDESNTASWLNTQEFYNFQSNIYWSSTTGVDAASLAWMAIMSYGGSDDHPKNNSYFVLPTRSGQSGMIQLPKTGQMQSYWTGDDGDLRRGVAWPLPRFNDNGNGTVTDNLTGLIWLRDADCFGKRNWGVALNNSNTLNSGECGLSDGSAEGDWRLPNPKELKSLIDYSEVDPALPVSPHFINVRGSGSDTDSYWSSSMYAGSTNSAWSVLTWNGHSNYYSKDTLFYVWPVRSGQVGLISGTVTSDSNGLSNVVMSLSGNASMTSQSSANGVYSFASLSNGSYTITPSFSGYTFNPAFRDVIKSDSIVTGQDFRACNTSVPLSGMLRDATTNSPLSGVTVTIDGTYSDITDSAGYYEISGLSCGAHQINVNVPSGYSGYTRTMDTSLSPTWNINLTKPETVFGSDTSSGYASDPVNTATGNYIYQKNDVEIPGKGIRFVFKRNYNSQDGTSGPLGYGWNHSYNSILTVNADSTVTIRWGDGKTETWTPDGEGVFTPQYGVFDELIDNADGTHTVRKKNLTAYNFNTSNMLSGINDNNGNSISLTYTGSNLTQITDTAGRNVNITYDASNRITQTTGPIGRTIQFSYDANGDLVTSTDMNGNITTYTYDIDHQILTVVDPRGNTVVTNIYDSLNRVVTSQTDAMGGLTNYTYDEVNRVTTIADALGNTYYHYHDELLRLIQEEYALGNSAYYTYDAQGNRTSVADKNGNTTAYTFDVYGNVTAKTDPLSNSIQATYDSLNNPLTKTDANGNITQFSYDANGNLLTITDPLGNVTTMTYDTYGQTLSKTDALGGVMTYVYDDEGNVSSMTDALGNATTFTYDGVSRKITETDTLGRVTTYIYDDINNILSITDALGNITSYIYDQNNNKTAKTDKSGNTMTFNYDAKDHLITETDPLGNIINYGYDLLDRRISVTDPNGNISQTGYDALGNIIQQTDTLGNTTIHTYDANGNLTSTTNPLGNVTTFAYDELNRMVSTTDALGNVITSTYDANGNVLTTTDPLGNTTTYSYNALDRLISTTDSLGNATTNIYDALGRVIQVVDANGGLTDFAYDALGRLLQVTDEGSGTVLATYDTVGNRLTVTDPRSKTTNYSYDNLNRLITETDPIGSTTTYSYDPVGNRISVTDPNEITISYTYDEANRLITVTYPDTSTVSNTYDANGNRIQMVDSVGTTAYSYDALNRIVTTTDPVARPLQYSYDANGNRIGITYEVGRTVNYTYDSVNRLVQVQDWNGTTTQYTYDASGMMTAQTNGNGTTVFFNYDIANRLTDMTNETSLAAIISSYQYTLDNVGNRTQAVVEQPLVPSPVNADLINFTYDDANGILSSNGTTYTLDMNGNLIGRNDGSVITSYIYDYEDRLTEVNDGTDITQYQYSGDGDRLKSIRNGTESRYLLNTNRDMAYVLAEMDAVNTVRTYYIYGNGLLYSIDATTGNRLYYHYNPIGSTVATTDDSENTVDEYSYLPFGKVGRSHTTSINPFTYVGQYGVMQESNGLYFMRARFYDPEIRRFLSVDPIKGTIKKTQSINQYIYVENNPIGVIDPTGLFGYYSFAKGSAKIIALGAAIYSTGGFAALAPPTWLMAYSAISDFNKAFNEESNRGSFYHDSGIIIEQKTGKSGTVELIDKIENSPLSCVLLQKTDCIFTAVDKIYNLVHKPESIMESVLVSPALSLRVNPVLTHSSLVEDINATPDFNTGNRNRHGSYLNK